VVAEHAWAWSLEETLERLGPDGVMENDRLAVARTTPPDRVHLPCEGRMHMLGVDLAAVTPPPENRAPGEGLVGDRIPGDRRGKELMDGSHGARSSTTRWNRSLT
jgi:hypothetical protein